MSYLDRQSEIDGLIKASRAVTPKSAVEQRKVPRYSIEALNDLDLDTIRDKYLTSRIDDRSPVVKAIDLIDLPRNVVANILFRPAGLETGKLRKGAFGLPSISFSDALGELGVKPGLIRGIAGFVGDVALDPLTYLGPPGWGVQVASTSGRAVSMGARGTKAYRRSIDALRKGAQVADPEYRALFDVLAANAGRPFKDSAELADHIAAKTVGAAKVAETKAGRTAHSFGHILGGEKKYQGGLLADALEKERFFEPGAQEARNVVAKYGKASAPGVSLGGRGSQVAHIPFTELSVSTKPFTRAGRAAKSDLDVAASTAARPVAASLTPQHAFIAGLSNDVGSIADGISQHFNETHKTAAELQAAIDGTTDPLVGTQLTDQLNAYTAQRSSEATALLEQSRAKLNELTDTIERGSGVDPIKPESIADIMAMHKIQREAASKIELLQERAKALPEYRRALDLSTISDDVAESSAEAVQNAIRAYQHYHNSVDGAVGNFLSMNPGETALVDAASKFLGTDERMIGRAAIAGPAASLKYPGASGVASDISRIVQNTFGVRGNVVADMVRSYQHSMTASRSRAIKTLENNVLGEIKAAFEAGSIRPTSENMRSTLQILRGYAHQAANAKAGRDLFYTTKFNSGGKPAQWIDDIQNAVNSGMFGANGTETIARLKAIAERYGGDMLSEMWKVENANAVESAFRSGYFPNVLKDDARAAVARGAQYADKPAVSRVVKNSTESFQKERSFDQVRWTSPTGEEKRIFRTDEELAKRIRANPTEIALLESEGRKDIADELRQLVADYEEYLKSPEVGDWHATDPGEMNDLFAAKRFSILTDGADLPGGFMHTDFLSALAGRVGAHHEALARESFAKMRQQWAKPIDATKFAQASNGQDFVAADGTVGRVVDTPDIKGNNAKGFSVGGQVYRRIKSDLRTDATNPFISMIGRDAADAVYPTEVVNAIERIGEVFQNPESVHTILKGIDTLTRYWKTTTLFHPSWMIFNMIGDTLNGISNQLPLKHFFSPKQAKFAGQLTKHFDNPEELAKLSFNVNGQTVSGSDLVEHLVNEKVVDGTVYQEIAGQLANNGYMVMPSSIRGQTGVRSFTREALSSDHKAVLDSWAQSRKLDRTDKFKAAASVLSDRVASNFVAPWFRINQKASNYMRINMFLSYLADGNDIKSAARKVVDSQFDYSNATQIERQVFKRMLPFYSWMRNNGAFQIRKLFESPVYAASYPKVQAAIEEAIAGEDRVPLQQRPNWMRQGLAMQAGSDPEHRFALMFGGALPVGDVYQYLTPALGPEGVRDFIRYFVSSANPLAGAAIDLGTGRERFSGRTIGEYGDVSTGQYLLNQVRPLAEVGKAGKSFDKGFGQGVGRVLLGGRVQDFGEERLHSTKLREKKERETMIRRRISKAEREGDKVSSLRARVDLLRHYDSYESVGLGDEVPKWARKQLESLNTSR